MTIDHKTPSAPHDCPACGEPSYIPFGLPTVCTNRECRFYSEDCWVKHVTELPDEEEGIEFDIEDEPTQPFLKFPSLSELLNGPSLLDGLKPKDPSDQARLDKIKDSMREQLSRVAKNIDDTPVPFYLTDDDE